LGQHEYDADPWSFGNWRALFGRAPYGHWKTTTFVCALRTTGLVAPLVLDGPINGPAFRAWVEQMLAPQLRPGDIVVLDNLGSHKVNGIAEAVQAAGAQLRYLPPYSPDYNPIEQVFAKLKTLLRKAARRTVDTLCGPLSATYLIASLATNASAISAMRVMASQDENALAVPPVLTALRQTELSCQCVKLVGKRYTFALQHELAFADHVHQFNAAQDRAPLETI
jgi:transposase